MPVFRDDAITGNKLAVSGEQFSDKYISGVWQNPYQTQTIFAMSPAINAYSGTSFQVLLPANLWHTNNAAQVSSIAVNFNNGNGYQTIIPGTAITVSYTDTGAKAWQFKLTLTNSTVLYSHTLVHIMPDASGNIGVGARFLRPGGPILLIADEAFNGQFGEGWITVDYANPASAGTGGTRLRLNRPLIVAEGFDAGSLLRPENQFGSTNFGTFLNQILAISSSNQLRDLLQSNIQQYDIIYVDWKNGTDFLQRNALLLERVIRWINEQKALDGSTQQNVVLGQSMGGVIARWALRDMENKSLPHQTRLYISYDAPHQGANVPLAYQHAARHANNLLMSTAIPAFLGGSTTFRFVKKALNLMDVPAARQMLYNRVLDNGNLSNTDHTNWQTALQNMGYPLQTRNIAVSNGSECAIGQGFNPGASLLSINGKGNTRLLTDIIGSSGLGSLGWFGVAAITGRPQFLLGILPGRNEFSFDFYCKAQPTNSSVQIYKGNINYKKVLLWVVPINTTITSRNRYADPSVLAIDGTSGGLIDTEINLQDSSDLNWAIRYNIAMSSIPHFNFIPTPSALDIGRGNTALTIADYQNRYIGAIPPATPLNSPFVNFTTAFSQTPISNGVVSNNEGHIQIGTRNGNWLAAELAINNPVPQFTNCSDFCSNNTIAGTANICGTTIFTAPASPDATYTWAVSNTNLVTRVANGNQFTLTAVPNVSGSLTITVLMTSTGACGSVTLQRTVFVGRPLVSGTYFTNGNQQPLALWFGNPATDYNNVCNLQTTTTSMQISGATSGTWTRTAANPTNTSWSQNGNNLSFYLWSTGQTAVFRLQVSNACGTTTSNYGFKSIDCGGGGGGGCGTSRYRVSPNPANGFASITVINIPPPCDVKIITQAEQDALTIKTVRIYDNKGVIKKTAKVNASKKYQMLLPELKTGVYFIEISDGVYTEKQQLVITK